MQEENKNLEGEIVEEKNNYSEMKEESLEDKKIKEFATKISELQREYSGYCILYAVNCMSQDGEISPMIKIKKLK